MKRVLAACAIIAALLASPADAANTVRSSAQPLIGNVANGVITYDFTTNETVMGAEITGLASTGATLTIEGSTDGRRDSDPAKVWFATVGIPFTCPSPSTFTTITADGAFKVDASGLTNLRLRVSTAGSSAGPMLVSVNAIEGATMGSCGGTGGGGGSGGSVNIHDSAGNNLTSTGGALNVAGTLTATVGGFTPALNYLSPVLSVSSTSSTAALPSGFAAGQVLKVYNQGTNPFFWTFGTTATTNMPEIAPYSWDAEVIPVGATNIAAITKVAGQTATLAAELGSGLASGTGGPIDLTATQSGVASVFFDAIGGIDNSGLGLPVGVTAAGTSSTHGAIAVQGVTNGISQNIDTPTSGNNLYAAVTAPIPAQTSHGVNIGGVEGLAASGSAVAGDPVLIGGSDGTNARAILTSTTGQPHIICDSGCGGGSGGTASNFSSAFPTQGTAIGLSNGTNMVPWLATSNYGTSPGAVAVPSVNADVTNNLTIGTNAALVAGAAIIGKVGIDQTTVGTTNGVSLAQIGTTTVATGTGAVGAGAQRVAIGTDTATIAGSAPSTVLQHNQAQWGGTAITNVPTAVGTAGTGNTPTVNAYIVGGGGSGGTSSSFGATYPATGTATGAEYLLTAPTLTSGQMVALQTTINGSLHTTVDNTNTNITLGDAISTTTYGAASPTIGSPLVWNGTTYDRLKEGTVTGSLLATLGGSLPAFAATPTFNMGNALVAGSAIAGKFGIDQTTPGTTNGATPVAAAAGGGTQTGNIVANNTTAVVLKASAGTLYSVSISGLGSAPAYVKMYNAASATCGSGTPVARYTIPAATTAANGAGNNPDLGPVGAAYGTGITYCVTTGIADTDATAPAANTFLVNFVWK